ncbi:pyridoxamine 5'-phosphate oxidase family protein [Arthrobacter dokdonensis]|uniref:pyridoxamine 5'-phosphate oxidase family protein n=1 Tax=Arthrobacter dokdonellae TaxID=2211210 RepID=UPI000DE5892E|nr:pyridoxamine 5'-phosphate oxidase family protein [Arthrobacter dokdonellae]
MTTNDEHPGEAMSTQDAWRFLEHTSFGRLAVSVADVPNIFPINYLAHDGRLLMRTNPGTKLAQLTVNNSVAFEIDGIAESEAWSVVVEGTARVVESQSEIDALDLLPLAPWIRTRKYTYVEITPGNVSGFRFELGTEPDR